MIGTDFGTGFRLDRNLHVIDHKVHFDATGQTPVAEAGESFAVGVVRAELMKNPILESLAIKLRARSQFAAFGQIVHDAYVGEEKFGSGDDPAFRTLRVTREPAAEQGVFKNLKMALDGVTGDTAVARERREIYQLGVGERGDVEKFGKNRKVSNESFRRHFFFQVVGDVRVQQAPRRTRQIHSRQIPVVEHASQIEVFSDLGRGQAMKFVTDRPAAKQISVAALDLAGARTTEGEVNAAILVQPVGFVEQLRNLLHLVDNYLEYGLVSFELGSKQLGVVKIAAEFLGFEQVYPQRVRIGRGQQRGFARLPGAPQKKGLCAGLGKLQ